jgi:imidazolonepropionase-like amidohydrolase
MGRWPGSRRPNHRYREGKIVSISSAAEADVPKDVQVLDLHGYSVIPGW